MAGENTGGRGGRVPADGRAVKAPAVGAQARRHDLERPATPGLADSDLQQGDVSKLEAGQSIAPIQNQKPNPGRTVTAQSESQGGQAGIQVPDAMDFATQQLSGTLSQPATTGTVTNDPTPWMPFLRRLATTPGAGGAMVQAYVTQLSNQVNRPAVNTAGFVDMSDLDDEVGRAIGAF